MCVCVCHVCSCFFWEAIFIHIAVFFRIAYDVADGSSLLSTGREWQKRVRPTTKLTRKPSRIELGGWEWWESHRVLFSLQSEECLIFGIVMACSFPEHCVWGHSCLNVFLKSWFMFYLRPRLSRRSARPERARRKPKQLRELPLSST